MLRDEVTLPRILQGSSGRAEPAVPTMDDAAFEAAVAAHFPSVWRFLHRLGVPSADVDDAAQEVIIVAARKRHDIVAGSECAFLLGTAFRVARRMRGVQARRAEVTDELLVDAPDAGGDPESAILQQESRAVLDGILQQMPVDLRAVFVLFEIEELSMLEIAGVLDLPPGTVASRLRRARQDFEARVNRLEQRSRFLSRRP
jgi:RNA polymerase sigma-70 factor, ECF subfamily